MKNNQMNINLDLSKTTSVETPSGGKIWSQGVILRKVSRFVTGTQEDGIIPVPCFFDVVTGKVLVELLPKELRAEFEDDAV